MSGNRDRASFLELVRVDQADFRTMKDLLEQQFDAALHHDTARVAHVCEAISTLTDQITQRGHERLVLAKRISGAESTAAYEMVIEVLPPGARGTVQHWYDDIRVLLTECKRLNSRNCELLMSQFEIMQRVLNDEVHTYAPA